MIQVGIRCNVQGCEKIVVGKGLCGMHTMRLNRHGHFNTTRPDGLIIEKGYRNSPWLTISPALPRR